ncbi:hypothetical protein ACHAWU_002657 [Discostella pseudostelligera]|uniref:NADH dehydrogenase [ubiquinone] iron-sulfur protein 4, mitochondrial n=1 Tax=Discostella pseudostelligera TaxID=259834 RepID=A0ABD3LWE2_9STRA
MMMMSAATLIARRAHRSSSLQFFILRRSLSSVPVPAADRTTNSAPTAPPTRTSPSAKALAIAEHNAECAANQLHIDGLKSEITKYREEISAVDEHAVFAVTTPLPDPQLPEQASEIAALDPAYQNQIPLNPDGTEKWVTIRQDQSKWPVQAPLSKESSWIISFQDNGETGETWDNPLMGWVSSADPMANNMRLQMSFDTAANAKYFCEKRGWKYIIEMPILRRGRDDSAQYQDCFLPQDVAGRVKREGKKCDQWYRDAAGASHYFRPLKYHGDGLVRQHGPNGEKAVDKDVESYYKMR